MNTIAALPETTTHFRRLESGILIPATSGRRTFITERNMFPEFFDSRFYNYTTDVPNEECPESFCELYEATQNGSFRDLLGSFNTDLVPLF